MDGCDHGRQGVFYGFRVGRRCSFTGFITLDNFFIGDHSLIIHVHGVLITVRSLFAFDLFVVLAHVVGDSQRLFIASLNVFRVIIALRKSVNHFLHGVVLSFPPGYVCVHVLN